MTSAMNAEEQQEILAAIDKDGWFGIAAEESEYGPAYEHTVGLQASCDHPEVIVFGLPFETMHDLLWAVYHSIREGRSFREEGEYGDLLQGFDCAFRRVHPGWHEFLFETALWHREQMGAAGTLEVMQILWPDPQGRWPWDPRCDEAAGYNQLDLRAAPELEDE